MDLVGLVGLMGEGGGEIAGHEAEFDHGADAGGPVGVEDTVEECEVVDGFAGGVEGVDVGGAPLELGDAVAAGEQVVCADVDGDGREVVEFGEELAAAGGGGVVGLVVAEPTVDGFDGGDGVVKLDHDGDGRGGRGLRKEGGNGECGEGEEEDGEFAHGCNDTAAWGWGAKAKDARARGATGGHFGVA